MVSLPPSAREDVQDFVFKACRQLQVFPGSAEGGGSEDGSRPTFLLAVASRFGLVFAARGNQLAVLWTHDIAAADECEPNIRRKPATDFPCQRVLLSVAATHIALSCDQLTLSLVFSRDSCPHVYLYDVRSLGKDQFARPFLETRLSATPLTNVTDLMWNPAMPDVFVACVSDGSVAMIEVKGKNVELHSLNYSTGATCLCWSPKGKQLVVGKADGTMTQYKPDLKEVKTLPAPGPQEFKNLVTVVNVLWISNYLFLAAYRDASEAECPPSLVLVSTPKGGNVGFTNYSDIFYTIAQTRHPQIFMFHQPDWSVIICTSSNAVDTCVFGPIAEDKTQWQLWNQDGDSRASIPFVNRVETYPIGMGLDTAVQRPLVWGENQTLPPMPMLHLLTTDGALCPFSVVNLQPNAPIICKPSEPLPAEGARAPIPADMATPAVRGGGGPPKVNLMDKFKENQISSQPSFFGATTTAPTMLGGSMSFFGNLPTITSTPILPPKSSLLGTPPVQTAPVAPMPSQPMTLPQQMTLPQPAPTQLVIPTVQPPHQVVSTMQSIQPVAPTAPTVAPTAPTVAQPKPKVASAPHTQSLKREPSGTKKDQAVPNTEARDAAYDQATLDEIRHFEMELREFHERSKQSRNVFQAAVDSDKERICQGVFQMELFEGKVRETTSSMAQEVSALRSQVLEGFRWAEEARSRAERERDRKYAYLVRCRPLDPLSARRMEDIRRREQYLEHQLTEVGRMMEDRAEDRRNRQRKIKRQYLPTMETVYQTVKNNGNILEANLQSLDDITKKIKEFLLLWNKQEVLDKPKSVVGPSELSQLADNFLKVNMSSSQQTTAGQQESNNRSATSAPLLLTSPVKQVSPEKQAFLRNMLSCRPVSKVRPSRPATSHFLLAQPSKEFPRLELSADEDEDEDEEAQDVVGSETSDRPEMYEDISNGSQESVEEAAFQETKPVVPIVVPAIPPPPPPAPKPLFQSGFAPVKPGVSIFGGAGSPLGALSSMVSAVGPAATTTTIEPTATKAAFSFSLPPMQAAPPASTLPPFSFSFAPKTQTSSVTTTAVIAAAPVAPVPVMTSTAATTAESNVTAFGSFFKQMGAQPKPSFSSSTETTTTSTSPATALSTAAVTMPALTSLLATTAPPTSPAFSLSKSTSFFSGFGLGNTSQPGTNDGASDHMPTITKVESLAQTPVVTKAESLAPQESLTPAVVKEEPEPEEKKEEEEGEVEEAVVEETVATEEIAEPAIKTTVASTDVTTATETSASAPTTPFFTLPAASNSTVSEATPATATNVFASAVSSFTFNQPQKSAAASTFSFTIPTTPTSTTPATTAAVTTTPATITIPTPTTSAVPAFGAAVSSAPLFGGASSFGQPSPAQTSVFGGSAFSANNKTVFGQVPGFGQQSSAFGTPTSSAFGGSVFGGSAFGQTSTATSAPSTSVFGSSGGFFSGLGGTPNPENANRNVFGGGAFSSAPGNTPTSLFGNSGATPTVSSAAGSGPFSSGASTVAVSGFVAPQQQQSPTKTGGFGGSPTFGGVATFGTPPAFGSSPAFGSAPAFGSVAPAPSFGSELPPTPFSASTGFGNFASANTPTFGSLAQQTSQPTFGSVAQQPVAAQVAPSGFGGAGFGSMAAAPSPAGPPPTGGAFGGGQQFGGPPATSGGFGSSFGGSSFTSWR